MKRSVGNLLGGCFVIGCATACFLHFAAASSAIASSDEVWLAVEHRNLFLHNLTSEPATFVTAMVLAEDDAVTAEIAPLNRVKFGPRGSPVVAARSQTAIDMETQLDREVVMNAAEHKVVAYFHNESGLQEIRLLPGEGVAIGELPEAASHRYRYGCKCVCGQDETLFQTAIMYCEDVLPNHPAGTPCDCSSLHTTPCWFKNEAGELLEGQMNGCKSGLVPVM